MVKNVPCSAKVGPNAAYPLKITDKDTVTIDIMPGPVIVSETVMDVADCSYSIVYSYYWATSVETTGYCVGRSISGVGTVGGVDTASSFETLHIAESAVEMTI